MRRLPVHARARAIAAAGLLAGLLSCRTDEPTAVPTADLAMQDPARAVVTETWLGTLPVNGRIISANSINDRGEIVGLGFRGIPSVRYLAVRWTEEEGAQPLPSAETFYRSEAFDINDRGDAVGYASIGLGAASFATLWPSDGGVLQPPSNPYLAVFRAINKRGVVAGGSSQAFTWTADEGVHWLGGRTANDINDRGIVAGSVGLGTAGTWTPDGQAFLIPASTTEESEATGINNRGEVVGIVGIRYYSRAFRWSERDGVRFLETPAGWNSVAEAINDRGEVAGWISQGGSSGYSIAVMWTDAGAMIQLGPTPGSVPGLSLNSLALDLNNHGQVVGAVDFFLPGGMDGIRWTVRFGPPED